VTTVALAKDPSKPTANGKVYTPVPLSKGNYSLGDTKKMSDTNYGTGIAIKATVVTPYQNGSGSYKANDLFIHQTPYSNTWGCSGVQADSKNTAKTNMTKVLNEYKASTGSKTISVR